MPCPHPSVLRSASLRLALFALLISASVHAEEKPAPDPARLIDQLRHDEFDIRRNAAQQLLALGESARDALERASASEELEIRQAAEALLQRLDKSTITLLAFDRDGKPAEGAEAEAKIYSQSVFGVNWNEGRGENVTIKATGEARLPEQAPGQIGMQFTWKKWSPTREGFAYWGIELERGNNPFLFTLTRGGTVKTVIQDQDGKPVKDATVYFYVNRKFDPELLDMQLICSENWDRNVLSASADAKGEVKHENLADGAYRIVVKASDFYTALGPSFRIHERETLEVLPITLKARKNGKIKFALSKADNAPLKKTRVSIVLEPVFEGPRADELQRLSRQLRSQMNMQRQADSIETDDDGNISLEEQKPGKYRLSVGATSETAWEISTLTLEPGQTLDLGRLKVVKTGSVKGKIVTSD
ncbi:MAG TPA: carboxypeptidase-like regulatory domain-containing protein, partial [Planctomycetota bacterium]|nr:carboxypeptidase-like regulatory domain-containing protein [Planctomycetota bacterium]